MVIGLILILCLVALGAWQWHRAAGPTFSGADRTQTQLSALALWAVAAVVIIFWVVHLV